MKNYFLLPMLVFLAACSGIRVLNTETADNADLSKYKTFDFYRVRASGDTVSALFNERIDILKEAIASELVKRGYRQSSSNPDLLVNIGIRVKEEVQTRTTDWRTDGAPQYIGQRNYSWKSKAVEIGRYREGTASIHLVDALQKTLVWKGVIQGIVPENKTNIRADAQKGMHMLFEKFPVGIQ